MPGNKTSVVERLKEADDDTISVRIQARDLRRVILALEATEKVLMDGQLEVHVPAEFSALFEEEDVRDGDVDESTYYPR